MEISCAKRPSTAAWLTLSLLLAMTSDAFGHEGHHHEAMGTVKELHENHLMLTTSDAKEQAFVLGDATKILRGKTPTTREDIVAGGRAVVLYETQDGANRAI